MGLFKCLNFQSFPLYLSKRKASVHFHEQMPCLKAVFLQPPLNYSSNKYVMHWRKYDRGSSACAEHKKIQS